MSAPAPELIASAQSGDREAAERLITENSPLIWSIVRRFFGRGADAEDLYQIGCVGFIKAVNGFDPSFGVQFSTYAVPKITGEIRRFLRDDGAVKVSRSLKERSTAIRRARGELEQELGREPQLSELCARTGLEAEEIATAENAAAAPDSLQRETGDGTLTLEGVLGDFGAEEKLIERLSLREAIGRLSEREKNVIMLRYFRCMTQDRAARILGVSQVQVSRLEKRAIESLRRELA